MKRSAQIAVIGAGGHAKVVISTLQAAGRHPAAAFDDDEGKWGSEILGVPVAGAITAVRDGEYDLGVIAIGNNSKRKEISATVTLEWITVTHPSAYVHPSASLGCGTVVFAGAVIQPETVIGDHAIVNTGATIDHDCGIGDFAHIAPGASLAGKVVVGEGTLIGIGSSVIPGIRIGSWITLGAGAVAVRDLPDKAVAIGVPARPTRGRNVNK